MVCPTYDIWTRSDELINGPSWCHQRGPTMWPTCPLTALDTPHIYKNTLTTTQLKIINQIKVKPRIKDKIWFPSRKKSQRGIISVNLRLVSLSTLTPNLSQSLFESLLNQMNNSCSRINEISQWNYHNWCIGCSWSNVSWVINEAVHQNSLIICMVLLYFLQGLKFLMIK